jgi:hypothetical protein
MPTGCVMGQFLKLHTVTGIILFSKVRSARHQWLTPVILTTQEAEIWRIMVQSQPWANSSREP